jgi:hypothetical protein
MVFAYHPMKPKTSDMKFSDLPKELQEIFVENYEKEMANKAERDRIDKKMHELIVENSEVEKTLSKAKARQRKSEINDELHELNLTNVSLLLKSINTQEIVFRFLEGLYLESKN